VVEVIDNLPKRLREQWDDLARRVIAALRLDEHRSMEGLDRPQEHMQAAQFPSCVIVGFSGGPDSTALLCACAHLRDNILRLLQITPHHLRIIAVHLDHGLRDESAGDADWCNTIAERLQVEFISERLEKKAFDDLKGKGIETRARMLRRRFFAETARRVLKRDTSTAVILLAHTLDDQAETVLINLARGAGLVGAGGMAVSQPLSPACIIIRPFLDVRKGDLESLLKESSIEYLCDITNLDPNYSPRNRIRNEVMPALTETFPAAAEKLAQFANFARESYEAVERYALEFESAYAKRFDELFPGIFIPGAPRIEGRLVPRQPLKYIPEPVRASLFKRMLAERNISFDYRSMLEIDALLDSPEYGNAACGIEASRKYIWLPPKILTDKNAVLSGEPFGHDLCLNKFSIFRTDMSCIAAVILAGRDLESSQFPIDESGSNTAGLQELVEKECDVIAVPFEGIKLPLRFAEIGKRKARIAHPRSRLIGLRKYYLDAGLPPSVIERLRVLVDARDRTFWHPEIEGRIAVESISDLKKADNVLVIVFLMGIDCD